MNVYWPRSAPGLPPGQRLLRVMPRFSDLPHIAPPDVAEHPSLKITVDGDPVAVVTREDFEELGPRNYTADFHCVTTWSVTGLTWTGVPLCDVLVSFGIIDAPAQYMRSRAADGRRADFLWDDATAPDVLLATHLDGEQLGPRHGGPLRLVAPQLYGYKSVKHIVSIDFRDKPPEHLGKMHLRGRVALEERHPTLPNWLLRLPYRLLIPPTALIAERTLSRSEPASGVSRTT